MHGRYLLISCTRKRKDIHLLFQSYQKRGIIGIIQCLFMYHFYEPVPVPASPCPSPRSRAATRGSPGPCPESKKKPCVGLPLCCGVIENPRVLVNKQTVRQAGIYRIVLNLHKTRFHIRHPIHHTMLNTLFLLHS